MNAVIRRHRDAVLLRLPIRLESESNKRGHWAGKARRTKGTREPVALAARPQVLTLPAPWTVLLTRVAPRKLDDDNLRGALKAARDGVADALGIDDADARVTWNYDQRRSEQGGEGWTLAGYGVEISIATRRA